MRLKGAILIVCKKETQAVMQMTEFSAGGMYENVVSVVLAACIYYFGK